MRTRSPLIAALVVFAAACFDLGTLQSGDVDGGERPPCSGAECGDATVAADGGAADGSSDVVVTADAACPPDQEPLDGGGCSAICAGKVCGAHSACGAGGACACVTGYTLSGAMCVFSGGPLDPGFQNTPVAWELLNGVSITPSTDAGVDPGYVTFPNACDDTALVRQKFAMPALVAAEPLALETSARGQSSNHGLAYALGPRRGGIEVSSSGSYESKITCLGERAYGGDVTLGFLRNCGSVRLDRAAFVPAADCPKPGAVANGDFETPAAAGRPGEWKAMGGGASVAACPSGYCATLSTSDGCSNPKLLGGPASVPHTLTKPALRFTVNASTSVAVQVALRGPLGKASFLGRVKGTNAPAVASLCLPEWSRGLALPVELSVAPTEVSGSCNPRVETATVDKLEVASDPACEDPPFVFDPGFERSAELTYGYFPLSSTFGTARIVSGGAGRSGTRYAELSVGGTPLRTRSLVMPITVPEGGHPTLRYFYRATLSGLTNEREIKLSAPGIATVDIPAAASWTAATTCLPKTAAGTGIELTFTVSASAYAADAQLHLDDFSVTDDATACP